MKKDLIRLTDFEREELDLFLFRARELKRWQKEGVVYKPLAGKTLGMIFEKSSTRTRLSFEVGMYQLGGTAIFLSTRDTQLGRGETVADTARIMSRYLDGVMIRTFSQKMVEEFASYASIPVINGLTDLLHPCQILSDIFTIMEKKGSYEGMTVAYIGDGNNVANSWLEAACVFPIRISLACPEGYEPDPDIMREAIARAGDRITIGSDPAKAVSQADVIYTDVWTSMGQEGEADIRRERFQGYQINERLLSVAPSDVIVMHCLPAHRGEEITQEVIEGPHSVVFDQAENRLHVQKAILEILMKGV
ncbi:MAG: ornithine carbamoyltransferase [Syntrophales bacterium]|nr:ornithine carbamoyltransferase [Syntrophales bacterium]